MKIALCSTLALLAVVGMALAQNFNNDNGFFGDDNGFFGNDDGFFGNDDGFFNNDDGGRFFGVGGPSFVSGGVSSGISSGGSWGSSWGSSGISSGGSWGSSWGGYGSGLGSFGYGGGKGGQVSYIPLPVTGGKASGFESLLPILFLAFLLPFLFNRNQGNNVVFLNQTDD